MDNKLLEIMVCPLCNSKLTYVSQEKILLCKFDRLSFPFDEDIPVLLPERATALTQQQVDNFNAS